MVYREEGGKLVPVNKGLDRSQAEEFKLAKVEERQPICVHCGELLDVVSETQDVYITWTWNPETKQYDKNDDGGGSVKPYCGNCEAHDWEFSNNEFIKY